MSDLMVTLHFPNAETKHTSASPTLYHRLFRTRQLLERHSFDLDYVTKLSEGDTETATHFIGYFTKLLLMKLRGRVHSAEEAEDVAQETLFRVLRHIAIHGGIDHPEALGGFVLKVSDFVVLEFFRNGRRFQQVPDNIPEPVAQALSAELICISRERKDMLRRMLGKLKKKDSILLEKVFLQEEDKDQICAELKINRNTLRVQVFRALASLRKAIEDEDGGAAAVAKVVGR
jgi:RNA polymerase sigma-70 factor (ECF subfamily)